MRSDRLHEDHGHAGSYLSVVDLDPADPGFAVAIERVFASYGKLEPGDQILIQRFVAGAAAAGVAASRTLADAQAYKVLSWTLSAPNSEVTAALSQCWTCYELGSTSVSRDPAAPMLERLCALLDRVRAASGREIEIEWLWKLGRLQIVQLRELAVAPSAARDRLLECRLDVAERARASVCGAAHFPELLGLMPDWNPAELLGAHPRPLALSLFQFLISDRTWREARAQLGYARVAGPLLHPIAGRPYVRVSRSLHSLLPATLAAADRQRVVAAQLERLRVQPHLHDRIEFAIASSAFEFGDDWCARHPQLPGALVDRLGAALHRQAPRIFDLDALHRDYERARFALRGHLPWPAAEAPLQQWRAVLSELRVRLAVPFAQSARRCFAYEALLQSAVRAGAIGDAELRSWRLHAATLGQALAQGDAPRWRDALRPGTFEISHARYGDWRGVPGTGGATHPAAAPRATLAAGTQAALDALCRQHRLALDADALLHGFTLAHQARDWGKLALSVEFSDGLERLAAMARRRGHARETLSWLRVADLDDGSTAHWPQRAARRGTVHVADSRLRLPQLLSADTDLRHVIVAPGAPVYLGRGRVQAPVHAIDAGSTPASLPVAAIVVLERCEPGFDWIFQRRPAAIVTAFGGPNAHVALRAHELDCPALLGVGLEACARIAACHALDIDFDGGWWRPAHSALEPAVVA